MTVTKAAHMPVWLAADSRSSRVGCDVRWNMSSKIMSCSAVNLLRVRLAVAVGIVASVQTEGEVHATDEARDESETSMTSKRTTQRRTRGGAQVVAEGDDWEGRELNTEAK